DIGSMLAGHLEGRATRANFRTGTMTVCTMIPMRSIPHRVVCLVGLDDGVFPRTTTAEGDDALARRPVTGERDPRAQDRQLLLDAVMAARQTLVITYTGADEHTGAPRPPAVPLGELIDAARATACGEPIDRLVTRHPLQPYDPRNLGGVAPGLPTLLPDGRPFSHDPVALAGGRALTRPRPSAGPAGEGSAASARQDSALLAAPLPLVREPDVDLLALQRFLVNPVGAFLRDRLGIVLPEEPSERVDGIPLELDGLGRWQLGDRLLTGLLAGHDSQALAEQEKWRGELPPHRLGDTLLAAELARAQGLADYVRRTLRLPEATTPVRFSARDVDLALPSGRRLVGTVEGVVPNVPTASSLAITYSSLSAKHRLGGWLRALALAATGEPMTSSHVIAHRSRWAGGASTKTPTRLYFSTVEQAEALALLDQLADLRDRGLREPLPLAPKTAYAWAREFAQRDARSADDKARGEWETDAFRGFPGEQDTPAHTFAFGEQAPFSAIVGVPADDERWHRGAPHRLGQYALRLWGPIARYEGQS
ncbi:exodeoxyribonuclease V gamma chain, partial [Kineosphaera limosa NBRC 100340]